MNEVDKGIADITIGSNGDVLISTYDIGLKHHVPIDIAFSDTGIMLFCGKNIHLDLDIENNSVRKHLKQNPYVIVAQVAKKTGNIQLFDNISFIK